VQYGYEKFGIYDERGTDIGFAHRRRDAALMAAAPWLYDAAEDAVAALRLLLVGLSDNRAAVNVINQHIDMLKIALAKASAIEARRGETEGLDAKHESAPGRPNPSSSS
jgi:phage terminase Nu1 subunit (DNA packaging protein)